MSEPLHRSPAFQFYADDFLAGTLDLSQEEVGAYVRLLCHQWNRGSIPVETEKQQRLAGGSVSVDVLAKFRLVDGCGLVNDRLEKERAKQAEFRQKQREKGLLSAEARKKQPRFNHGSTAVGDSVQPSGQPDTQPEGNSPVSSLQSPVSSSLPPDTNTPKAPKGDRFMPPTREQLDLEAAKVGLPANEVDAFVGYYGANGWKVGRNPMKSWSHALAGWAARWRERNGHLNNSGGRHGQPSAADIRRSLVAGAADTHRDSLITAAKERALAESDDLPI